MIHLWTYCEGNPITFTDPDGFKIQIPTNQSERNTVLKLLKRITNHDIAIDKNKFVYIRKKTKSSAYKKGDLLISRLINSKHICEIYIAPNIKDSDSFTITNSNLATKNGVGANSIVFVRTKQYKLKCVKPGTGGIVVIPNDIQNPTYIILAHELIHADRNMRGVAIDERYISNHVYHIYRVGYNGKNVYLPTYMNEHVENEELATIGFKYNKPNDITENQIRKEHRLWQRGAYF